MSNLSDPRENMSHNLDRNEPGNVFWRSSVKEANEAALLRKYGWKAGDLKFMAPERRAEIMAGLIRRDALARMRRERIAAWRKAHPRQRGLPSREEIGMDRPRWELLRSVGIECEED